MDAQTVAREYKRHLAGYGYAKAFDEGIAWYPEAWAECRRISRGTGYTPERVAAIVAILSPRARWSQNVQAARLLVGDGEAIRTGTRKRYRRRYGVLPAQVRRARVALDERQYSALVSGPKVSAFYRNIVGDVDTVTVDTIMCKASGLGSDVTPQVRAVIVDAVGMLAREYGMSPRDMQAAIWCAYRGKAN